MHKVSCTNFKALLHAAAPLLDKGAREAQRTAYRNINTIFNDPSWTKAVFYREPLGRFLSGWLDKCNDVSRVYCVHVFGDMNVSFRDAVLSLAHGCNRARSFVHAPPPAPVRRWVEGDGDDPDDLDDDHLGRPQLQPCLTRKTGAVAGWGERHTMDGHFRQQTDFCGGLGAALGGYQVVQQLELSTSRERVGKMLARSNITEVPNKVFDRLYPHQGARGGHSKRADEKLEQYYSDPQLVGIVTRFYYDDYVNFQIPLPAFARRTLDELAARRDPFAMPTEQLNVLAAIRGPGIARFP